MVRSHKTTFVFGPLLGFSFLYYFLRMLDAVLLPTMSDNETPRDSYQSIKEYYDTFLLDKPQVKVIESYVTMAENGQWCQDNGIYQVTSATNNTRETVHYRYSVFYVREDNDDTNTNGEWKIAHHHQDKDDSNNSSVVVDTPCMTKKECQNLFYLWNDALATLDAKVVAQRFAKNAVLLPTVSDVPRTTPEAIERYFVDFLKLEPQGTILESYVTVDTDYCQDSGVYQFTLKGGRQVKARYSFVYVQEDGIWKILHQHSSQMPEEIQPKGTAEKEEREASAAANSKNNLLLDEKQVRDLFQLWNKALASGDAKQVAARYSKQSAILLPTISDIPRMDQESLIEYYESFLQKKPQGKIIESVINIGQGWCEDCGVYQLTMGATGEKVLARYTFVYVLEDGEWTIAHHHSSPMPEPMLKQKEEQDQQRANEEKESILSEEEVAKLFDQWNEALASKDATRVAALYHPNSLLLPTISDVPRMNLQDIQDYYQTFLQQQPQAVIRDRVILTGKNFAEDAGAYEFTMGATGEKVLARFSFVYTRETESGQWKIYHHHSSAMPQALMDAARKYKLAEEILKIW
jgi:uncharacterized protein (TIGR02246 family)